MFVDVLESPGRRPDSRKRAYGCIFPISRLLAILYPRGYTTLVQIPPTGSLGVVVREPFNETALLYFFFQYVKRQGQRTTVKFVEKRGKLPLNFRVADNVSLASRQS